MKVSFKKLWVLCAEKEMSKAELRKQAGLSSATFISGIMADVQSVRHVMLPM